ncbi:lipocalin-like domain-containing protein [Microbulbifer mangrovi]|uniref:lipocalin-like domain-containing protein n=1 Tax=Microbulbifer mangrovi TaxID=927787 RepID=UPI00099041E8|nr:lipocalin-like domain-containing protein [Microbulbifer mangrovi]
MKGPGRILLVFLLLAGCAKEPAPESSLGALSDPPEGFRQAEPGMTVKLPEDMGPHPEYRLEWWYLTANLQSAEGERFGVQWTLFRSGIRPGPFQEKAPGWKRNEIWLAHAALSRPQEHHFADRAARGGTAQAGVEVSPFKAWIDHWELESLDAETWQLVVDEGDFRYRLKIQPQRPVVLNGDGGFSAKSSAGGGSMYFSYPLQVTEGEIQIGDSVYAVTGQGWFDREWSSQYLKPEQEGWDWMALHLDDGRHLMLFRVRGLEDFYSATLVAADGTSRALDAEEFSMHPVQLRKSRFGEVPVAWGVKVPSVQLNLLVRSWPGDYWNPGTLRYWEGPVLVGGSHTGEGYLEMTGYEDDGSGT